MFNKKKLQFDTSGAKEFKFTCGADGEWAGDLTCKSKQTNRYYQQTADMARCSMSYFLQKTRPCSQSGATMVTFAELCQQFPLL